MLFFGALVAVASTAGGAYLAWENRHARVRLEVAGHIWTGHLYGVLLAGAVLAAWTMFGLSCIALWRRERRERRAAGLAGEVLTERPEQPRTVSTRHSGAVLTGGAHR